ncbi:uncharacterized protein si:ch211-217g15.3 isoform X2 [Phyllopteryx taeniolatus]|uniref:uncharacterized protein si:ch211-217g15.3 isoform X2 n=1 Tax=Phyllopteryx taeniolatus TaxID=161469 RepID=UPI002AD36ABD|nr:uncharacterized protein si:ch211-217g15.3 isoform X2 [Phyllopteryx taeniolatus]
MFRITLLVTLIFGIAAKPYKPWNKLSDNAFQDTVMSVDARKMPLSVEVEPPQDMDQTDYDIDPKMKIWENVAAMGKDKQVLVAEADLDDVHHPSLQKLPAEDEDDSERPIFSDEPEQGWDEVYHKARAELDGYLAPLTVEYKKMVRHVQPEPEETEALELARRHLEPEEDTDDLYHPDVQSWMPNYQDDYNDNAAAPFDWKSDENYDERAEDLDHLYHR